MTVTTTTQLKRDLVSGWKNVRNNPISNRDKMAKTGVALKSQSFNKTKEIIIIVVREEAYLRIERPPLQYTTSKHTI